VNAEISRTNFKEINKDYFLLHHKNKMLIMLTTFFILIFNFIFTLQSLDPPNIAPIVYKADDITSHYGIRMHPIKKIKKLHTGIDIKASIGTEIVAPSDGTITDAGFDRAYGFYIEIKHDNEYSTRYHHLSEISVTKYQKISKGKLIGKVGSTGLSTAPHLHYEVLHNGKHIDPKDFLKV
jgi:murein DD-endopeptidase MepM/ murein hydrolase activator NlpD